jgi:hypothetical protein
VLTQACQGLLLPTYQHSIRIVGKFGEVQSRRVTTPLFPNILLPNKRLADHLLMLWRFFVGAPIDGLPSTDFKLDYSGNPTTDGSQETLR